MAHLHLRKQTIYRRRVQEQWMRKLTAKHHVKYIPTFLSLKYKNIIILSMLQHTIPRNIDMFCNYSVISACLCLQ
jgi:hypothetical protein